MPPREESRLVRGNEDEEERLGVERVGVQVEGGSRKPWTDADAQVKTRSTGWSRQGGARIGWRRNTRREGLLGGVCVRWSV